MPWAGQPVHAPPPPAGPALFLYPTNDSFVPKMISLTPSGNRVKIGRQTNTKTVPGERNGYFDSKVLSRQHAEVWEENNKIYIKDVKSSNGTFVNGERLSVEGMESDPWELHSDDRVEFGIDIVGEDNKTIIHHKVAATVFCVITPDDYAQISMHHPPLQHHNQHPNGAYHMQQGQQQRRPSLQQAQSPVGLGGLGGGPGLGLSGRSGKSGLTFDHILSRLQNELQKSRETHSELNSLAGTMTDISENLVGGALPPSIPSHHALPPVRPPPPPSEVPPSNSDPSINLSSLQSQITQTQSVLASHADKVKGLESVLAEHEHVKREVQLMRDLMEQRKIEMETLISHSRLRANGEPHHVRQIEAARSIGDLGGHSSDSDDDDRRSILTITQDESSAAHDRYAQDEQDRYDEEDARAQTEAMGRPRTPEPHGMGMSEDDEDDADTNHHMNQTLRRQFDASTLKSPPANFTSYDSPQNQTTDPSHPSSSSTSSSSSEATAAATAAAAAAAAATEAAAASRAATEDLHSQNVVLSTRLETLAQQLDSALGLSRTLHSQAEAAQQNIELLEAKVKSLEVFVETTRKQQQQQEIEAAEAKAAAAVNDGAAGTDAPPPTPERENEQVVLSEVWETWRQRVEGQWRIEREEWEAERVRLQQAVRDWEARMAEIEQRDQRRSVLGDELFAKVRREREEAQNEWRGMQDSHAAAVASAHAAVAAANAASAQASAYASARAVEHSSDDEVDVKPRNGLTNGITKTAGRKSGSAGKQPKKRRSQSAVAVATPPHSPTMNGDAITERSSEASGSRSTSPERERSGLEAFTMTNGHIKPELLPLSPAPSVRNGGRHGGARSGSATSEPDSTIGDDYSSIATTAVSVTGLPSSTALRAEKASQTVRTGGRLRESPLPYISVSVVFIGLAAWAFASRAKD